MKPSTFKVKPFSSVLQKSEAETVACNIMVILARTGDTFRDLSWEEYKDERLKDGAFNDIEKRYFDKAMPYCLSAETAAVFSPKWAEIAAATPSPLPKKEVSTAPGNERQPDILDIFIQELKNEFNDMNWEYLPFVADRVRLKVNDRQEGEGFTQQQAAAMLKSLESLTQYLETMGDFIVEDAEKNENAYSKAKALINSITGGK